MTDTGMVGHVPETFIDLQFADDFKAPVHQVVLEDAFVELMKEVGGK
jgi:hypothetical protein